MKIICKDNFDRESFSDSLVCEKISEYYGEIVVNFLNANLSGDYSPNFYRLVDDDYELYKWEP